MADVFFDGTPGRVKLLEGNGIPAQARSVNVQNFGDFNDFKAIITRVAFSKHGNFQFLHSLGRIIHLYVFGDRMGQFMMSGMAFSSSCDNRGNESGLDKIDQFYEENKISARAEPLVITLGAKVSFQAYLHDLTVDVADPQTSIYQYNMNLSVPPKRK